MLKLIKYEFRKQRTGVIVLLGIIVLLFAVSLVGKATNKGWIMAFALSGLGLFALFAYLFALISGILAYSTELKNKTGYLLMLTPRSTYSILFGKLMYSMLLALLLLGLTAVAFSSAAVNAIGSRTTVQGYYNIAKVWLANYGVNVEQLLLSTVILVVSTLVSMITIVSIGYLAVTLSATILQDGKGRGFITFLLFIALMIATEYAGFLLMPSGMAFTTAAQILPTIILYFVLTILYTCVSGLLLKKRVCL